MNEPLQFLPAGGELARWLRARRPDRGPRWMPLVYRWRAHWFDRAWALQRPVLEAAAAARPLRDPVWIVGLWRSGTTYLHELLSAHPESLAPQTWQCFSPAALLRAPPARGREEARPMDAMRVHARSPQEDEFALLALGHASVYRGFADPGALAQCADALDEAPWVEDGHWAQDLRLFLAGCGAKPGRFVLKSPNHLFRIGGIRRWFPGSRIVWIHRDPAAVWHSNRKMWNAMAARYSLWKWKEEDIDAFLMGVFERYEALLRRWLEGGVPITAAVSLGALNRDPAHELERIGDALSLSCDEMRAALRTHSSAGRQDAGSPEPVPEPMVALLQRVRDLQEALGARLP